MEKPKRILSCGSTAHPDGSYKKHEGNRMEQPELVCLNKEIKAAIAEIALKNRK